MVGRSRAYPSHLASVRSINAASHSEPKRKVGLDRIEEIKEIEGLAEN